MSEEVKYYILLLKISTGPKLNHQPLAGRPVLISTPALVSSFDPSTTEARFYVLNAMAFST